MNTKQIHIVGISGVALAGIGTGILIGYFIGKKRNSEEVIIDICEEDSEIPNVENNMEDSKLDTDGDSYIMSGYIYKSVASEYNYDEDEQIPFYDEDEEEDTEEPEGDVEYVSDEPYLVVEEDVFHTGLNPNDIEQLTYYQVDDVLADRFGEIITDRKSIVGTDFVDNFGYGSNDTTVVYVRNPKTKRDYEISLDYGSYEMEVLEADEDQYRNAKKYFNLGGE